MEILGWVLIGLGSLALIIVTIVKLALYVSKSKRELLTGKSKPQTFVSKNINYFLFFIPILIIAAGLFINFGDIKL
ncbi:hypothetical protein SCLARK_001267 [Spiroplasma clarkii]|uniref:Uncharacterized protein n=1 Tax=Spiroplasma clarkii TaxID=2139 RepID=A0A1Y0L284_9MOLU|nr:hypothetical protein [Spiroplasma clarkii]ARU91809.1 hypothetical protein SCLARK_001267 [Spiroplasma clarkii]ATX71173.1 hypothetical protein SCLAR_v1c08650 [Spiroplasma clarkii]